MQRPFHTAENKRAVNRLIPAAYKTQRNLRPGVVDRHAQKLSAGTVDADHATRGIFPLHTVDIT